MNTIFIRRFCFFLSFCLFAFAASARQTYNINSDWRVFTPAEGSGDKALNVHLPYYWNETSAQKLKQNRANYLRTIYAPFDWQLGKVYIKFHGVADAADLFINGEYVGEHRGGGTAFLFDISKHLNYGEDNNIFVSVNAAQQNDILPTSLEQIRFGGIYDDVEIITTPKVAIAPNYFGADGVFIDTHIVEGENIQGEVKLYFSGEQSSERDLTLSIYDDEGKEVFEHKLKSIFIGESDPKSMHFHINKGKPWSPSSPSLYTFKIKIEALNIENESSLAALNDEISIKTGLRVIGIPDPQKNEQTLTINGESVIIKGVGLQQDGPSGNHRTTPKQIKKDFQMIQDLGATAIRSTLSPHSSHLYDLCDKAGILVWVDSPFSRSPYISDIAYYPTSRFEENGIQQLKEIIYQNYNHPSITMWGLFSLLRSNDDSRMTNYVKTLNSTAKICNSLRPTVALSNQNGDFNSVSDLIVWQQNIGWNRGRFEDVGVWSAQLHKNWKHFRSGVLYGESGNVEHIGSRGQANKERERFRPESRQSEMHEVYATNLNSDNNFWGIWLSSMFDYLSPRTPSGINAKGLVTFDRQTPKDAYYLYRALWNEQLPTLHIADKRGRFINGNLYTLRVYSSNDIDPAMVHIKGKKPRAMNKVSPSLYVLDSIPILGSTKIVVFQGRMADSVVVVNNSPLRGREH